MRLKNEKTGEFISLKNTEDILGKKINNWFVKSYEGYDSTKKMHYYWCKCECGTMVKKNRQSLTKCKTSSCHICRYVIRKLKNQKSTGTRTYNSWSSMRQRCNNPNRPEWKYYGGRGIKVCERWFSYKNFMEDMGERPLGTSLDRIDTNGNYAPNNCRWATKLLQARNTRSNSVKVFHKSMALSEWAEMLGVNYHTLVGYMNYDKSRTIQNAIKYFISDKNTKLDLSYSNNYRYEFNGELRSAPWIAKKLGIRPSLFLSSIKRLGYKESLKYHQLIKEDKKKYNHRKNNMLYAYKDRELTLKEWCSYLKAERHSFYESVKNHGFNNVVQAYDIPTKGLTKEQIRIKRILNIKQIKKRVAG